MTASENEAASASATPSTTGPAAVGRGAGNLMERPPRHPTEALLTRREEVVLATGPTTAWWGRHVRRWLEGALRELGIEPDRPVDAGQVGVSEPHRAEPFEAEAVGAAAEAVVVAEPTRPEVGQV